MLGISIMSCHLGDHRDKIELNLICFFNYKFKLNYETKLQNE